MSRDSLCRDKDDHALLQPHPTCPSPLLWNLLPADVKGRMNLLLGPVGEADAGLGWASLSISSFPSLALLARPRAPPLRGQRVPRRLSLSIIWDEGGEERLAHSSSLCGS